MNTLWLDTKYADFISSSLPLCTNKPKGGRYATNFRCVVCGDSRDNPYKKRGWIYEKNNNLYYGCFNCGYKAHFSNFLKEYFPLYYKDYTLEKFKEKLVSEPAKKFEPQIEKFSKRRIQNFKEFKGIPKISQLPVDHPAKQYVMDRKIPSNQHYRIFYVDNFAKWANSIKEDAFREEALKFDEPRIVFPFIDPDGYVYGFQGRSIDPNSKNRYITIMLRDDRPKVFGLELFDKEKTGFIFEGPIDSLFIENSVAMAGADTPLEIFASRKNSIIVFDNEPRNPEIVSRIDKYINQGWKVCIWPESIPKTAKDGSKVKDVNDMVRKLDYTPDDVRELILSNYYSGLQGKLKLTEWDKSKKDEKNLRNKS